MILTIIVAQINLKKICLPNTQKVVYNILMKFCKTFYQTILVRSNNKSSVVLLLSVETQEEDRIRNGECLMQQMMLSKITLKEI